MQPQDTYNVVRRALDVEDYIDILRRHKAWIFGPAFAGLVVAVVTAFLWPDTYVSQAIIRVVPPRVPESLVQTNVNVEMNQRINSMAQTILSRDNLTNIIHSNGLYPGPLSRLPMEDVIDNMKKDIKIGQVLQSVNQQTGPRSAAAFQVTFAYSKRLLAQKVCQELVAKFMNEDIRTQEDFSLMTTQFLKDQWESAKKELDTLDQKLTRFRMDNQGRLPEQLDSNLRQLNAMQERMASLNGAIGRINQEKLLLESDLKIYKDRLASLSVPDPQPAAVTAVRDSKLADLDRQIGSVEDTLTQYKQHYTDTHPDVQRLQGNLTALKHQRETFLKEDSAKKPDAPAQALGISPSNVREARDVDGNMRRMQAQIEAKDLEMRDRIKELNELNNAMKGYQGRIEGSPIGEKEYAELLRDRDMAKQKYLDLDAKTTRSQLSTKLTERKQGEMLEVLDPASLPVTPTEPKRPFLVAAGFGLGLLLGLFMAGAREMKDTSLKNLKDVRAYAQLTILGSIPLLENDLVVRRRRRISWLAWSTACLIGVGIMSSSVVYYYATRV